MAHDDAWLDGLAGRGVGIDRDDATQADAREGRLLRDALMRWAPAEAPLDADPDRLAGLIARARAAGLFDERTSSAGPPSRSDRLRAWWAAAGTPARWAMAATLVGVVGTAYVLRPGPERSADEDTVRAAPGAVTLLRSPDPERLRRDIVDALARQGVQAVSYARFGRLGIDADVPSPPSSELRAVLARYRIPVPVDGVLRVEIEAVR